MRLYMPKKPPTKKTTNFEDVLPVGPENYSVVISKDELLSLVQMLAFSRDVASHLALDLLKNGNEQDSKTMSARSLLSDALCSKFKDIAIVGEPEYRQVH